jgi:hypothetical protein
VTDDDGDGGDVFAFTLCVYYYPAIYAVVVQGFSSLKDRLKVSYVLATSIVYLCVLGHSKTFEKRLLVPSCLSVRKHVTSRFPLKFYAG